MCACVVCFPPQIVDCCVVKKFCTGETESYKTKSYKNLSENRENCKNKGRQRKYWKLAETFDSIVALGGVA